MLTEVLGILAIVLSAVRVIPQIVKTYKIKRVRDVSFVWEIVGAAGTGIWTWYAYLRSDWFLMIGAGILFLSYVTLMIQHKIYQV